MSGPGLSQVQSQRQMQVMAPQMRQSLKMLQVPVLELQALVAQELEQNPTLDETPLEMEQVEIEAEGDQTTVNDDGEEVDIMEDYEKLAKLDDDWRDYYRQTHSSGGSNAESEARRDFFMNSLTQKTSLQEHLNEQLGMLDLSTADRQLGELLIGCIDDDGFLNTTIEEFMETGFDARVVELLIGKIQDFEPAGVGARDLRESLMVQLRREGREGTIPYEIVEGHLQSLGGRKYPEIASALGVDIEDIKEAAEEIGALEPKPGREFASDSATYVLPEVYVFKNFDGDYEVQLSDEHIPNLRISRHYRNVMESPDTPKETKRYVIDKIKQGEFLIRSIQQRQDTIRSIAEEIVHVQKSFLDEGVAHLKPLTMSEVADVIGKHETTVSRAIANKFIQTPQGVFEMKYFFTPGFKTANGADVSNEAIKNAILKLVDAEDKKKPLSDSAMQKQLEKDGTKVARRTIAKYREELKILPSHMRKSY